MPVAIQESIRWRFRVRGTVQGVGFRPYVFGLATRLGLAGFVINDAAGVVIEIEGDEASVESFRASLTDQGPPLAIVTSVEVEEVPLRRVPGFVIGSSERTGPSRAPISPDIATCDDCLAEIRDPTDRRFRYPFTNCTNCGPRFTITKSVPYDRPNTTMARFVMCQRCRAEYQTPSDRRFHAQPIACPACGPRLSLFRPGGQPVEGDPLLVGAHMIASGAVLAVKGLGGFHLVCDATNEDAVTELRTRKRREEKPLAVMVADVETAADIADIDEDEWTQLTSNRRPIVLVRKRPGSELASSVAPDNRYVGLMLPYTPLHHLLLAEVGRPVVMTSGNATDEPIAYLDEDAMQRLGPLVDAFLTHDRVIRMRCDDSVVRVVDGHRYPIRRSRGLAPEPLTVNVPFRVPILGAGAQLKHTFCIGIEDRAVLSQHIGDLETYEAMAAFEDAVAHFTSVFEVQPEVIAHDLHPDYLSTKWALGQDVARTAAVQHHHAHIASCLADNGRSDRVIGLALDGTGLGDDGTLWGCELLVCDLSAYSRHAHLAYVPVPGGEAAIREPWRMAAVYLTRAFGPDARDLPLDLVRATVGSWQVILQMAEAGINSPPASSAGRLFDAVAALCCNRYKVAFEGQGPAALEQLADPHVTETYPCRTSGGEIEGADLVAAVAEDLIGGRPPSEVAARFHNGVSDALAAVCNEVRESCGLAAVALSGGSFQNLLLLHGTRKRLERDGFEVLVHRRVPPNDGGISLGQVAIAGATQPDTV